MLNKLKPQSEFSRNVLTLMTGTTIAQAIPIAISPILTRIYTPEDFGVFALYMSVASIPAVIATGSYEHAIMLPKNEKDAVNIVALSILMALCISLIVLIIVYAFNAEITSLLGSAEISNWLYLVPVTVLFTGLYQSFNYWNNRKKEYKRLSKSMVAQSGTTGIMNLGMGALGYGSAGLIWGGILGKGVAAGILGRVILREDSRMLNTIGKLKIIALAKKYSDFLKFSTFSSILNSLSFNLFSILLARVFSTSILGFYNLIYRVLSLPSALIGSSISQVYFEESTRRKKLYGNNKTIFIATMKKLFIISALVYFPMYLYVEELVVFVFGSNWRMSGEIAYILIPLMFIRFVSSVMSSTLTTYEKQKSGLLINFILALTVIILFLITYFKGLDVYTFFYMYMIVMSLLYTLYLGYYYHLAKGEKIEKKIN